MDIKTKVQGVDPNVQPRDIDGISGKAANIYEALAIISKRSQQLSVELNNKLEEFAVSSETIEEISENKEQIEISKFYERLPNPSIIALEEFIRGDIAHRYVEKEIED
jgi:hypothetical protein